MSVLVRRREVVQRMERVLGLKIICRRTTQSQDTETAQSDTNSCVCVYTALQIKGEEGRDRRRTQQRGDEFSSNQIIRGNQQQLHRPPAGDGLTRKRARDRGGVPVSERRGRRGRSGWGAGGRGRRFSSGRGIGREGGATMCPVRRGRRGFSATSPQGRLDRNRRS